MGGRDENLGSQVRPSRARIDEESGRQRKGVGSTNGVLTQRCAATEWVGGANTNPHQSGCRAFKIFCFGFILSSHGPNPRLVCCTVGVLSTATYAPLTRDPRPKRKCVNRAKAEARRFVTPRLTNPNAKITGLGLIHDLRI